MPNKRAITELPEKLAALKIPTFVHTVNKPEEAEMYLKSHKISEIYTDFLPPN